jgi:hypothetical protein
MLSVLYPDCCKHITLIVIMLNVVMPIVNMKSVALPCSLSTSILSLILVFGLIIRNEVSSLGVIVMNNLVFH